MDLYHLWLLVVGTDGLVSSQQFSKNYKIVFDLLKQSIHIYHFEMCGPKWCFLGRSVGHKPIICSLTSIFIEWRKYFLGSGMPEDNIFFGWIQEKDVGTIHCSMSASRVCRPDCPLLMWGDCNCGIDQRNHCVNLMPQLILQISWGGGWSRSRTESIPLQQTMPLFFFVYFWNTIYALLPAFTKLLFCKHLPLRKLRDP